MNDRSDSPQRFAAVREPRPSCDVVGSGALPKVTVLLINWCAEEFTAACIASLRSSDYDNLGIVLVDNASPDGSGEGLRRSFPDVTFIQSDTNLGFTGGTNLAMERALADSCEYVLLLNNDTTVEPDCITRLVEAAENEPKVGAVGGKILYYDAPDRIWFAGGDVSRLRVAGVHRSDGQRDSARADDPVEAVSFLTGCCMLVPASVARAVGGLREEFFAYVEDLDLSLRLASSGHRLLYQPRARVYHRVPPVPVPPTPMKIALRDRNRRLVAREWLGGIERLRFGMFFYPSRIILGTLYLLRGDIPRARAIWRGMTER